MEGIEVPPLCPDSRLEQSNGNCGLCAVEAESTAEQAAPAR